MKKNEPTQNYTWLSVKEVAALVCKDVSTIQKLIKSGKYITKVEPGRGRGGKQIYIALESLGAFEQQTFFQKKELEDSCFIQGLTEKEREKLYTKYQVVRGYLDYKALICPEGRANRYLADYNAANPAARISRSQLFRWTRKYEECGLQGLYDSRGTNRRGTSSIPDEAWETFYGLWFHTRATVQQCYEMTCQKHKEIADMPSYYAFRRKLESIPEPVRILRDKGKKAFDDRCLPYQEISYESLHSNQQWVADHHVFDVLVEDSNGRIFRPWLTAWLDRRSRYITGYEINSCDPNSDIVLRSFASACRKCGIPEEICLDNGKDFRAYDLFERGNAMSVAAQMGIKVSHALPYNAKAKPIERFFRTMEEKYFAALPCYIAGKPHLRPEQMNMTNRKLKLKGLCMPYKEFLNIADLVVRTMNNTQHTGKGMNGKSPYEVYTQNFTKPVRVVKDTDVLNLLFQRTSRPVKVGRNGIRVPAIGLYYDCEKLFKWIGREVFARYDSGDISRVYVYTPEDRYICTAYSNELTELGTDASMELIREYNRRRKERKKIAERLTPGQVGYSLHDFLKEKAAELQEYDAAQESTAIQAVTASHRHLQEIREADAEGSRQLPENAVPFDRLKKQRNIGSALHDYYKKVGGDI